MRTILSPLKVSLLLRHCLTLQLTRQSAEHGVVEPQRNELPSFYVPIAICPSSKGADISGSDMSVRKCRQFDHLNRHIFWTCRQTCRRHVACPQFGHLEPTFQNPTLPAKRGVIGAQKTKQIRSRCKISDVRQILSLYSLGWEF